MGGLAVVDLALITVLAASVLVGGVRGFVRESLSLVIWVAALIIAGLFAGALAEVLATQVRAEGLRYPLAFGALFIGTLVVGSLVTRALGMLVDATGLTGLDRTLGVLFGAARAAIVLVIAAAMTAPVFAESPWWQASLLLPWLLAAQDTTFEFIRVVFDAVSTATSA